MKDFTHLDQEGKARMVDVSEKGITHRIAVASGSILMKKETLKRIMAGSIEKGDVLAVARIAGIMAAKNTPHLIPLCHPLNLTSVEIFFYPNEAEGRMDIESKVKVMERTGVEMEALTAVSISALTIYDMCKAIDREMLITEIKLIEKSGGRSGIFKRLEKKNDDSIIR